MQGIYVPLMTPFNSDGSMALNLLEGMVDHHVDQGANGFYVGGSSSECFMMSLDERSQVLKAVAQANHGRLPLIAHIGAISLHEVYQLLEVAEQAGYQAVSATPPFYYGFSKAEVSHYYQQIALRSKLPLLLYNIPGTTGVSFTTDELLNLSRLENVVGIKHTTSDMFFIERLRKYLPQSVIFHGEDTMLVNGLQMGASGGIGSTYNLMSKHYVEIYQAVIQGDLERAMEVQHQVNDMTEKLLEHGVYQSIKFAMSEIGVNYGHCREPFLPLTNEQKLDISKTLIELNIKCSDDKSA